MSDDGGPGANVPDEPGHEGAEDIELRRLRAEVAELRARLAAVTPEEPARRPRPRSLPLRRTLAALLAALAGFGLVASAVGVWGARTALNTDRWVAVVAPLPEHPEVNAAMSAYLTDQVFTALKVEQRVAQVLPPDARFLADPLTTAVHDRLRDRIRRFMGTEQFADLWESANRRAHARVVAVLEGRGQVVSVSDETVTLNLLPVVNNVLVTLSAELPTLFGKEITLPTLTSGQIPPDLRQRVQNALGVTLPADFAQITVHRRGVLAELQDAVVILGRSVFLLVLGTVVSLAAALWISPARRRTTLQFGVAVSVGAVVLTVVLRIVRDRLLERVPEGVYREGASVAVHEIFTSLRKNGVLLLCLGIVVAVVAYLAGPGRLPVALRGHVRSGWRALVRRARSVKTGGTGRALQEGIVRHADALRIAGVVVAAVAVLVLSSWAALLVVAIVLAVYEAAVTFLARGRPPGPPSTPVPPVSSG
ncbi:hypothetical protein [Thermomonospora amylolytica]|uniref:hypothetical protein n=1 Tax=Thermomonospora amylolytica TaxID=1411117 RepID=UPI000E6D25A4|nr:hypothetical protein [Thermomonospora amylolytica]